MSSLFRAAGVLAFAVAAGAACSSSHHPVAVPTRPGAPATITAAPSTSSSLQTRQAASIRIDNPDGLVEVAGAIWVKTDDGRVLRIDPQTNKITGSVKVDTAKDLSHYCQGIGTDGTAVWACTASDSTTGVLRIDPHTLATGNVVAVNKVFDQLTLPHTARGIWVLSGTGQTLTVVEPASGRMTSYPLGAHCQQVATSETVVVATCANDNKIITLDPITGTILGQVALAAPRIAAVTQHDLWVDTATGLTRLDLHLATQAVYPHQIAGLEGDLAAGATAVWVRSPGAVLWRIDPVHNNVIEKIIATPPLSAGSMLVTADGLWVTANNEGVVFRLRP